MSDENEFDEKDLESSGMHISDMGDDDDVDPATGLPKKKLPDEDDFVDTEDDEDDDEEEDEDDEE